MVVHTILILAIWFASLVFPMFLTSNKSYKEKDKDPYREKIEDKHFLKQ